MLVATEPQKKEYLQGDALLNALLDEFGTILPPMMAEGEVVVELAWKYGVKPDIIERLYIQCLDGIT